MEVASPRPDAPSTLADYIRRQGLSRGDRLPSIRQLADALGMGRNAVRDCVLEAQTRGLVKVEPRLGVFIVDPQSAGQTDAGITLDQPSSGGPHNVFHLVDARLLIELEVVRLAAEAARPEELLPLRQALDAVLADAEDRTAFIRADEAFHLALALRGGNPVLVSFLKKLLELLRPVKEDVLLTTENRQQTDQEHIELYRCVLEHRSEEAQDIIRNYLSRGRELLLAHLRHVPASKSAKTREQTPSGRRRKS